MTSSELVAAASTVKLTPSQRRVLTNVVNSRDVTTGIYGQSAHGGHSGTMYALWRKGLLRGFELTPLGKVVAKRAGIIKAAQ